MRHGIPCEYGDDAGTRESSRTPQQEDRSPSTAIKTTASTPVAGPARESRDNKNSPGGLDTPYSSIGLANVDLPDSRLRLIELYLMHRFKSSVTATFPSAHSQILKDIYVWSACDTAFDYPHLLNAIFAITALYIWMTASSPRLERERVPIPETFRDVDFAQLHRTYLNECISQQRDALSVLGPENADAVGLTAVLLSIMSTCLLSNVVDADEEEYTPPVQWMNMASSVSIIFQASIPFLKNNGVMLIYLKTSMEPNLRDTDVLLDPANTTVFGRLLEFQEPTNPLLLQLETNPTNKEAYRDALALIGSIHKAILSGEPAYQICMRVVAFGPMVPKPFIHLVGQRRPRALAILANYMAFVKYCDHYWWFRDRAEKEILGIQRVLPPEWQWALRWPLAVLEVSQKAELDPRSFLPALDDSQDGVSSMA